MKPTVPLSRAAALLLAPVEMTSWGNIKAMYR